MRRVLLACLLLLPGAARASDHVLGLAVGLRSDTVREDLVVPLGFSGPGLDLAVRYGGRVGPGLLAARLQLGTAPMWNRFGQEALAIRYGLDAAYVVPVIRGPALRLALGGIVALDTGVNYLHSWDDAHAYWLGTQWLGPTARVVGRVTDGWRFELAPAIALAGLQSRPPGRRLYKQDALTEVSWFFDGVYAGAEPASFLDLQVFRVDLALRRASVGDGDSLGGWAFGVDGRAVHSNLSGSTVLLSAVAYAAFGWEL